MKNDLISRRALQITFDAECIGDCMCCRYNTYREDGSDLVSGCALIDNAPAVDAVPVAHGRWIGKPIAGYCTVVCSACRSAFIDNSGRWKFCPDCGARMDGKEV